MFILASKQQLCGLKVTSNSLGDERAVGAMYKKEV